MIVLFIQTIHLMYFIYSNRNKEECKILGYTIPKSSFIVSNLYNVLHDPNTWNDPDTFRPERFLTPDGTVEKPEYFIPFSLGISYMKTTNIIIIY